MDQLISVVGTAALLGSALVGGIFFAFSSFVMKALARVPAAEGIAAMQSINVVVLNPSFLSAFIGTAVLSLGAGGLRLGRLGSSLGVLLLGWGDLVRRRHGTRDRALQRALERPAGRSVRYGCGRS